MTIILEGEQVRNNLATCLRGTALSWYTSELVDGEKRLLKYGKDVDEWITALTSWFKESPGIAMKTIMKEKYTMEVARRHKEPREYAQVILRAAKSASMTEVYNQLFFIYNGLDVEFQRDMTTPTPTTNLSGFLQELDSHKEIWWALGPRSGYGNSSKQPSRNYRSTGQYRSNYNSNSNSGPSTDRNISDRGFNLSSANLSSMLILNSIPTTWPLATIKSQTTRVP